MKILWVKTDFLHPTTRGGQIRTLEMLRRLHARHEVHYVAFDDPENPEGLAAGRRILNARIPRPSPCFVEAVAEVSARPASRTRVTSAGRCREVHRRKCAG